MYCMHRTVACSCGGGAFSLRERFSGLAGVCSDSAIKTSFWFCPLRLGKCTVTRRPSRERGWGRLAPRIHMWASTSKTPSVPYVSHSARSSAFRCTHDSARFHKRFLHLHVEDSLRARFLPFASKLLRSLKVCFASINSWRHLSWWGGKKGLWNKC